MPKIHDVEVVICGGTWKAWGFMGKKDNWNRLVQTDIYKTWPQALRALEKLTNLTIKDYRLRF